MFSLRNLRIGGEHKEYFLTQLVQAKSFDKETIETRDGELHGRRGRRERGRRTVRRRGEGQGSGQLNIYFLNNKVLTLLHVMP